MYLKSIEIQGFKSFANKIRFDFHNGITGIVGPNGSGKSNVADAVRWVLGEQRIKQLRGSSMQDVIFSGTEARKPLGFAYVAITLDNSDHKLATDYEEVTVARRIFRSGESEYLLNGTVCRLRDINELFYDTGIGKEGYSIIGQGQIDKILSDKPEDRRELFDEAAGIVKFKHRKNLSMKKLADEQENMLRVSDILAELEKQIPTLQKQTEKAKIYLKEKEALKKLEVNVFLLENSKNLEELDQISGKMQIAENGLTEARKEHEGTAEEYSGVQERLQGLEKEIEEQRNRISNAEILRSKLEGEIKVFEEQIRAAAENMQTLRGREQTLTEEIGRRKESEQEALARKLEIDEAAKATISLGEEAGKRLETLNAQIRETTSLEEDLREKMLQLLHDRAAIRSSAASIETLQEQSAGREKDLRQEMERVQSQTATQGDLLRQLREEFAQAAQTLQESVKRGREIEETVSSFKGRLTEEDGALQNAQQAYHREKSRLDALVNLTERYEGFGGSVRRVMQCRASEPGVLGVVADLIKTERRYETAMEVALGGSIQNVVVRDTPTARRMIDLLKREKAGRATFLPLTDLSGKQTFKDKAALQERGAIGLADTLVTTEPQYRDLAAFLLGRILIVDTFENAAAISRKYHRSFRMVTLDGELFTPGGAISGGTYKNSSNLLGRRREMAELKAGVAKLAGEVGEHEAAIRRIKDERSALRIELEENRKQQQDLFLQQNTLRLRIEQEQRVSDEAVGSREELEKELAELEAKRSELARQKEAAHESLENSAAEEKRLSEEIARAEQAVDSLREEESRQSQDLSKRETEREVILQKQSFEEQNLKRITEERSRFEDELREVSGSLSAAEQLIADRQNKIKEQKSVLQDSQEKQGEGSRLLAAGNEERDRLSAKLSNLVKRREELAWNINLLEKEAMRLQNRQERLQEQLDSRTAYMWEEYEITRSEAADLRDETLTDLPVMREEISQGKSRIKALGSVNVDAIEEYRELMERYTFLKGQYDDLTKAAENLQGIIRDLDEAMRERFREQFANIQAEFDKVFRVMFGGGRGRLELMEDTDILEAGVRVIAQPPGKKLQNMMQLSGGEKALTAIALLFAIQNLKPSPFCLLDEIEAALDESNVVRFAGYLHKLTEHTQFIVITHRRGTMKEADRLYGITMQEKGISALVSVDLIGDDELS